MRQDLEFQIKADGNFLKVTPTGLIYYGSNLDWDKNWIRTVITVQGGVFSGRYNADLERLLRDLTLAHLGDNEIVFSATCWKLRPTRELGLLFYYPHSKGHSILYIYRNNIK